MLRVFAKRTRYCDGFGNLRMDKVSMTAFAPSVDKARSLKVANKLSYFRRHQVTLCGSVAVVFTGARVTPVVKKRRPLSRVRYNEK